MFGKGRSRKKAKSSHQKTQGKSQSMPDHNKDGDRSSADHSPHSAKVELEPPTRLSDSLLWDMQTAYYHHKGIDAWSGEVPFFVTSNHYIAWSYAKMLFAFMQDWQQQHPKDAAETFYIAELGTGSGQLSFYILKNLQALLKEHNLVGKLNYCYIMTDFTENNLNFWREHKSLKPFYQQGCLDDALFNMATDEQLHLNVSGKTLDPSMIKVPLTVVGNYIFDTVSHDAFRVVDKRLTELRLAMQTPKDNQDEQFIVKDFKHVDYQYSTREIDLNSYYDDPALNKVLMDYQELLKDSHLLIPITGIQCVTRLMRLANNKLLLISSDKAHAFVDELQNRKQPHIAFHGSFSLMVNYDAIARFFKYRQGQFFRASVRSGLKTLTFNVGFDQAQLPRLQQAQQACIEDLSPCDYFALYRNHMANLKQLTFEGIISLLRFSRWDSYVLNKVINQLTCVFKDSRLTSQQELLEHLPDFIANHYALPQANDVHFNVALCYHYLGEHKQAISFYEESVALYGERYYPLLNMALCYEDLGYEGTGKQYRERAAQYKKP